MNKIHSFAFFCLKKRIAFSFWQIDKKNIYCLFHIGKCKSVGWEKCSLSVRFFQTLQFLYIRCRPFKNDLPDIRIEKFALKTMLWWDKGLGCGKMPSGAWCITQYYTFCWNGTTYQKKKLNSKSLNKKKWKNWSEIASFFFVQFFLRKLKFFFSFFSISWMKQKVFILSEIITAIVASIFDYKYNSNS